MKSYDNFIIERNKLVDGDQLQDGRTVEIIDGEMKLTKKDKSEKELSDDEKQKILDNERKRIEN
jgi:hypothetical protein